MTFMPPESGQNAFSFTMMLLTGCLSYANSAVNPILYAFLSDNFKKSFAKAFTCAARREVDAQLHVENSVFPKSANSRQKRSGRQQAEQSTAITNETVRNGLSDKGQKKETEKEVTQV